MNRSYSDADISSQYMSIELMDKGADNMLSATADQHVDSDIFIYSRNQGNHYSKPLFKLKKAARSPVIGNKKTNYKYDHYYDYEKDIKLSSQGGFFDAKYLSTATTKSILKKA